MGCFQRIVWFTLLTVHLHQVPYGIMVILGVCDAILPSRYGNSIPMAVHIMGTQWNSTSNLCGRCPPTSPLYIYRPNFAKVDSKPSCFIHTGDDHTWTKRNVRKIAYANGNWRHQNISSTEYLAIPSCNFSIGRMIHVSKRYGLLLAIEAPSQSSVIRPLPVAFWGCTASFCSSSDTCICV